MMVGRMLGLPVVMTARGTDVSLIPLYALPRHMIRRAAARAAGLITVSAALKDALVGMGIGADGITVLRNGVDLHLFRPLWIVRRPASPAGRRWADVDFRRPSDRTQRTSPSWSRR